MNVGPGGKQRVMRDGFWDGKPFPMNRNGVPKGLKAVLEERGVSTQHMNADKMREILGNHSDFKMRNQELNIFKQKNGI